MASGLQVNVNLRARVNAAGQTTIPSEVCNALGIEIGDLIEWEIAGEGVAEVRRCAGATYLHAVSETLEEWDSAEDDEAYGSL